jgi:hypothetical protein
MNYVCMYVCMYVYMYVCMYIYIYMYVYIYVCVYICMYVCVYVLCMSHRSHVADVEICNVVFKQAICTDDNCALHRSV